MNYLLLEFNSDLEMHTNYHWSRWYYCSRILPGGAARRYIDWRNLANHIAEKHTIE